MKMNKMGILMLVAMLGLAWNCGDDDDDDGASGGNGGNAGAAGEDNAGAGGGGQAGAAGEGDAGEVPEGPTADFEFDVVSFKVADGDEQKVHINGLPLEEMAGADRVSGTEWETTTRTGVRFSEILDQADITADDDTPVNCVARDNFDPLRTKLGNDTSKLVQFAFFRDNAYVYVGSPGDKDPLYPEMEGKSLIVDYDIDSDGDVPAYLEGTLAGLGMFRWKMIEEIESENVHGVIEIDPVFE